MSTAVDTNALVALFSSEPGSEGIADMLFWQRRLGRLYICAQVYAELVVRYEVELLRYQLADLSIDISLDTDLAISATAAERWRSYLARRAKGAVHYPCHNCGQLSNFYCSQCGESISGPRLILADFLIGADALHRADTLVTLDRGIYRTYYPEVRLLGWR